MRRKRSNDLLEAFQRVTDAAERFVNRSPRSKRLEAERQDLLDAIRQAQLLLSVKRLPAAPEPRPESSTHLAEHRKRQRSSRAR